MASEAFEVFLTDNHRHQNPMQNVVSCMPMSVSKVTWINESHPPDTDCFKVQPNVLIFFVKCTQQPVCVNHITRSFFLPLRPH